MRYFCAFGLLGLEILSAATANSQEILVNRYDVLVQHDKLNVFHKTGQELDTDEGRALVAAACAYFGCDPSKVSAGIAGAAKLIVPGGQQDMKGLIQTPVGYTICYAAPSNPNMGSGDKGVETHGDTTFNTTLLRVAPGVSDLDGLAWYMSVPFKAGTDTRVNAVFDVTWVKASPGWQQKYPQCRKRGEHPWLARNNETQLNVPCTLGTAVCE